MLTVKHFWNVIILISMMDFRFVPVFEENDINVVCRVCLNKEMETMSVFEQYENDTVNIHEVIMNFCSVEIKPNDGLTERICLKCIIDAKNALSFKLKCENAQNVLLNYKRFHHGDQVSLPVKEESDNLLINNYRIKSDDCMKLEKDVTDKRKFINETTILKEYAITVKEEDSDMSASCSFKDNAYITSNECLERNTRILRLKRKEYTRKRKSSYNMKRANTHYCEFCNFKTKYASQIRKHLYIHTGEKPLSCDECEFRCIQSSSLRNHKAVHRNGREFSCKLCSFKSTISTNIKRHLQMHAGDKPYACNVCSYRCVRSSYLEEHKRTHTGEKPFLCDQCHYKCTTSSALATHKRNKHQHERKFLCDLCDFRAKSKPILISHIKIHTGDKRFACDICSYRSIHLITLENHKKMVHTLERPFACEQCPYRGVNISYLKNHRKCHQPIKSFACEECGYTCHTKFKLKCHQRTHTGEKPNKCSLCDFKCSSTSSLRRHEKRTHGPIIK